MRVDASLVTLLLTASASAQYGYNSTATNSTLIAELEREIQALHQQLEDAGKTCDNAAPGFPGSDASSTGAASPAGYTSAGGVGTAETSAPSYGQPAGYTNGASSEAQAEGAAPTAPSYGQSTEEVTSVSTIIDGTSTVLSTIVITKTLSAGETAPPAYAPSDYTSGAAVDAAAAAAPSSSSSTFACNPAHSYPEGATCISSAGSLTLVTSAPAATGAASSSTFACNPAHSYPEGVTCVYSAGSLTLVTPAAGTSPASPAGSAPAGYGQGESSGAAPPATSATSTADFYAPNAPTSTSTIKSTVTVIVTPGQTAPTSGTGASTANDDVETCTETYVGTAPIPSPPAAYDTSAPVSQVSATSGGSGGAYPYPNGTTSAFGTGVASTGIVPSGFSTSASSSTFACNPAHVYPNGAVCTFSGSSLTLVTPTASASVSGAVSVSANSTVVSPVTTGSDAVSVSANGTAVSPVTTTASASASGAVSGSGVPANSANATSTIASSSSTTSTSSTATASPTDCSAICSGLTTFNNWDVTPLTCTQLTAGTAVDTPSGQSSVGCASTFTPAVDLCQITLNIKTSGTAETYMEVWLPNGNTTEGAWNGRTMSTDNGGLNGCVHYVDMQYVSGLGFAAIGDNAGHNGSSFDGTWTMNNNEAIIDWSYRARHASVDVGKQVVSEFYSKNPEYSYYIGCSAGGSQGIQSAEMFPDDFDGIIAGSSANDFNHLQDWSAHFRQITGATDNDTFLTVDDWTTVQSYIFAQCDEPIDGVNDGILEDPTQCDFNISAIPVCSDTVTSGCLTATQIQTVEDVFKPLYNADNQLIYPALLYGSQVDAFKLGLLSGSIQGISQDWFRGGVYNDSSFDILTLDQADYARADELDDLHGNPSAFSANLGGFRDAGKKLIVYHGLADPMTSGTNSQRYYLKVAQQLGVSNTELDDFYRFFRISGMAHCGVGGISGAGAWMFGQSGAAASSTNSIVDNLVDWVENGAAPETLLGTKFWYDTPSLGIEFERAHCRFPYRTTYNGGDSTLPASWTCELIENWQDCADELCSADGTFT